MPLSNVGRKVADSHTAKIFRWLKQVDADSALHPTAFRLAFKISQYINRKTGDAWPSQATLATALGRTERAIRDVIEQLRARGHLAVEPGRGRHQSSHYRLILKDAKAESGSADENRK